MENKHRIAEKNKPKPDNNNGIATRLPKLKKLEKRVNETVIGQDDLVRSVCTKIYQSLMFPQFKTNILLVGRSGTGKTEIVRQIAKYLNMPCTIEDATRYTENGYVGSNITDMVDNLITSAKGDLKLASRGIIFVDEIDKKTSREEHHEGISREGVLKSLLKIVEGTKIEIKNPNYKWGSKEPEHLFFDTSNIIFIFGGAFEGLDKLRGHRLKKHTKLGFVSVEPNQICINTYLNTSFAKEDLIEYGLPAELVGRISSIYQTRELEIEDLKKILDVSKKSEFRKYEKMFESYGISLIYSEKLFELIASNARKSSTGARELNSLVSHIFEKIMYDTLSNSQIGNYTQCVLDDEIVSDNTKYHWK